MVKDNKHYCEYFDEIISHGFVLQITLPTKICESTSSLIDNILTNNIDVPDSLGTLLNQKSDHQIVFTLVENLSYLPDVPRFIDTHYMKSESLFITCQMYAIHLRSNHLNTV